MKPLRSFPSLSLATALAFHLGCSSSATPEPNLRPASISVVTPADEIQVSHRLKVQVRIDSVTALQGVGVAYRLFPKAQYDAHDPNTDGHVLGTSMHDVPAGGATFAVDLQVPYETEPNDDASLPEPFPAGEYYVVPEVDPRNTIAETDETDNSAAKVAVLVRDEHRNHPRLMIESAVLDVPAFELSWVAGVPPDPVGLTVLVRAEGGDPDAPVPNAEITACVRGPKTDCVALPLGIWDGAAGRHLPRLVVPQLVPGEPTSVHLDLHFGQELASVFKALLEQAAQACLADVQTCADAYQANVACVQDCIPKDLAHLDPVALQACLLKCLPFEIVATIDKPSLPGFELFRPSGDGAARTTVAALQLVAPPPADPRVPAAVKVWPVGDPAVDPCQGSPLLPALEFVAERVNCAEEVLWSVRIAEGQPAGSYSDPGRVVGTNIGALYWTPTCDAAARQTKVLVEARACRTTTSTVVTLLGLNPSVAVQPPAVAVTTGADGTAQFTATLTECSALVAWSLEGGDAARLVAGRGTVTVSPSTLTASYRPPPTITMGPPVDVTLRASAPAPCLAEGTATITVGLPTKLEFEKEYAKTFANNLFGAGVDLYAGAFLDRAGGRANAHAVVPVKVFGQSFELLRVTDDASVDPRPPVASHFDHRFELFGKVEHELHCPGDAICSGQAELWSKDWCIPPGPPPVCFGSAYAQVCKKTTDCPAGSGLRCLYGTCTQKCDEPDDCNKGNDGICLGSLKPGPYKKVFVVVVVPVTVEGRVCAEVGIQASLDLLRTAPNSFEAKLGPYFEAGGYASAAAGYSGLLAVGVRGELVLVRDDFYGGAQATIELVDQGAFCPYAAGCIRGALREGIENVLQGGEGQIYLFADYPTLKWCRWYPCIRIARSKLPIVNWGSLFEVESTCDWCTSTAQCPTGVECKEGKCDDGRPGLLCLEQPAFVSAE